MCGIDGYAGKRKAAAILAQGLIDLAYRGYDSAGIATIEGPRIEIFKREGNNSPEELYKRVSGLTLAGTVGIGHNRWATHGAPSVRNAHPHLSQGKRVAVVHNGIIDNFKALRAELEHEENASFRSDTDSEVLAYLIERELNFGALSLEDAVHTALAHVEGAYAIGVICTDYPDQIVAARNSSDLIIGVGEGELFLTSDEAALPTEANLKAAMKDGDIVTLFQNGQFHIRGHSEEDKKRRLEKVCIMPGQSRLGNHAHFMLKEILEQPEALRNALRGRIDLAHETVRLGCFTPEVTRQFRTCDRVVIIGCGTSYYSGLAGKLYIERFARVPVDVALASEYHYSDPIFTGREVVLSISQSGTTADTLNAMRLAQKHGVLCLGITNRVGSTLAREDDGGVYLHAGPEKAVASTKAFTSQVAVLALIAMKIAQIHGQRIDHALLRGLDALPSQLELVLRHQEQIKALAARYKKAARFVCFGRGYAMPLALEGALKLTEIPYFDAHGYAGGELKHGPLALIERGVPAIAIVPKGPHQEKMISNVREVVARKGEVIALVTEGDQALNGIATEVIELPEAPEEFISILAVPVFQLLSYYLGLERECNVDRPRNLAKSVTVE
ncbi:MAG: glutamine--fructose-6-phosphate transaminase (isomerizing) [Patescibacteria group bacterium]|nr:glutamine--fructose-6-phosphate transaminase (isomerizing) [Patescibacteria group bacterium]